MLYLSLGNAWHHTHGPETVKPRLGDCCLRKLPCTGLLGTPVRLLRTHANVIAKPRSTSPTVSKIMVRPACRLPAIIPQVRCSNTLFGIEITTPRVSAYSHAASGKSCSVATRRSRVPSPSFAKTALIPTRKACSLRRSEGKLVRRTICVFGALTAISSAA